jgi:hypothetical protein
MNKAYVALAAAFVGGTALGAGAGYFAAVKRLNAMYEVILDEENEKMKEFYSRLHKTGEYSDPVSAADVLVADAAEAMGKYQGEDDGPHHLIAVDDDQDTDVPDEQMITEDGVESVEDVVKKNIWHDSSDEKVLQERDPSKPYVITEAEWAFNESDHDQINLTYFAGDQVLADDADGVIEHVDQIVGILNLDRFGVGTDDPNVLFVRNEKLGSDYEIARREDKYKTTVLGLDDDNHAHIQHSDEPMPRKRRLRD